MRIITCNIQTKILLRLSFFARTKKVRSVDRVEVLTRLEFRLGGAGNELRLKLIQVTI